ncbi:MAG: RNA polymerase sigma factor [Thermoanaerobaculia bacterium]
MALPTDEILLAAFAKGDREAFDHLASRYAGLLDAYFRRRLADPGRVEELRQETLLALYSILPSYREKGRFRSLVFSIAYRKLASSLRSERSFASLPTELAAAPRDAEAFEVRAAVDELPERLREALLLTRFEGLTALEAGEVLSCSADAVRARVYRAKTLLARKFKDTRRSQ